MKSMSHNIEPIPGINPFVGFIATLAGLFFGRFMPEIFVVLHYHIPPLIMEGLQGFAFAGTGIIGSIAGYKFLKEKPFKKFIKKKGNK